MSHDNECWACGNPVIFYRDVLDMAWCEPCWNQAEADAIQLRRESAL